MDKDQYQEDAPRKMELFVGVGLAGISAIFLVLFVYFIYVAIKNSAYNVGVLAVEIIFIFIGISLGVLSYRLIKGRGINRGRSLLSNSSLYIWGTVFGVAGVIMIPYSLYSSHYQYLGAGFVGVAMGLGAYKLVKHRKEQQ